MSPKGPLEDDCDTRFVQPYEATKAYICPGCNQDIPPRTFHLVAVPRLAPDLRIDANEAAEKVLAAWSRAMAALG